MKLTVLFLVVFFMQVSARGLAQQVTLRVTNMPVKDVLYELTKKTGYNFIADANELKGMQSVSLDVKYASLKHVLARCFDTDQYEFVFNEEETVVIRRRSTSATPLANARMQERIINGKVRDSQGQPIAGVTVSVQGTQSASMTGEDGAYVITIPPGGNRLLFTAMGYEDEEAAISSSAVVDVILREKISDLDEVVVTGYMTQRKADLTGSIALVSAKDIEKNSYSNVMQGLQGRLPGVYVTTDGNPVGNANVQIRGLTSMRSAPPLIVIDGFPTNINLRDINPNDIASIQVLKDAASASIYGSRAASGVILVETKKGKTGESSVSYSGRIGASTHLNKIQMMSTQQFGEAFWRAAINEGQDPNTVTRIYSFDWSRDANDKPVLHSVTPREWLNDEQTMPSANTDWFDAGTQVGLQNDQQITISNGTENSRTLFAGNYFESKGTQIHTGLRRISLRLNSEYELLNKRLTVGENISISNAKINDQNHMHSFLTMPPIIPVYTTDGGWGGTAYNLGMDDYNNPVRMLTLGKDNAVFRNKLVGSVFANVKILDNLTFRTLYGIDYTADNFRHIDFTWVEGGGKRNINNGVRSFNSRDFGYTWTNTLNYNLSTSKHHLDILAGIETSRYVFENVNAYRRDIELENYDYAYLSSATGTQEISGIGDEYTLLSYFSKFNYSLMDKYLLSATVRYDGSSKFGSNNRFGFFPALSAGWRISEEAFMRSIESVSDFKLRASWGMNGNSNIPTNALINYFDANYNNTSYGLAGNESGTLYSGYRRQHVGNPDLRWEATWQANLGFDFGFLNQRISGSFDYFYKYTDGMLYEPPYLAAVGEGGYQWINAANMTNRGVELIVSYADPGKGDFRYTLTGSLSSFRNKVDDLPESVKFAYGGNGIDDDILGRPLNSYYGFVADGLFRTQDEVDSHAEQQGKGLGRIRYKDLNNDGRITWEDDRTWIGVSDPKIMYGLNVEMGYKSFDFTMFWQGVAGNTVRNDWKTYSDFWNVWTQSGFNHPVRLLGAWTEDNYDSTIPALSLYNTNDERRVSTYFMESGSYLKLRHIEVGYTLPVTARNFVGMTQCRLFVNAQNVINIYKWWGADKYTGIDPETPSKAGEYSSPYLRPQVFMFGVNVSF